MVFLSKYEVKVIGLCYDPLHDTTLERCKKTSVYMWLKAWENYNSKPQFLENTFTIIIIMKIVSLLRISQINLFYVHIKMFYI